MDNTINKLKTLIGFAIKSKSVIWGYDNILTGKKKFNLIIMNENNNDKIKLKLSNLAEEKNLAIIELISVDLSAITHKNNIKAIAIVNINLVSEILSNENSGLYKIIKRGNF